MRYIGSKVNLLNNIAEVIKQNVKEDVETFLDLFSGTGVVGEFFKKDFRILSNDNLYFSYILQKSKIESNSVPQFSNLKKIGIKDPLLFLETESFTIKDNYFITYNYSPYAGCERMYFTIENASRIDFIRQTINEWKEQELINEKEFSYLLATLIEAVPFISNISGTYGAYLKHWDKRALGNLELRNINVLDNKCKNKCYNMDANKLISKVSGDLLYIDTPYNNRQYISNYHVLETIAKYDYPKIYGKTGLRPYEEVKSKYCMKKEVAGVFEDIIKKAKFRHIVISYSSDGLLTDSEIKSIVCNYGLAETFKLYKIPYRKYKSKHKQKNDELYEYIIYIQKDIRPKKNILKKKKVIVKNYKGGLYIKSPLNYIGGKYKILKQILPLFPTDINNFVDLFTGGLNVGINVNANTIYANDINNYVIEILKVFREKEKQYIVNHIETRIDQFKLSKENEEGFKRFRDFYNKTKQPLDLYTLICYSFNYQFRFNNNHEYNNPFGRNRSQFSDELKNKLIRFIDAIKSQNIIFSNEDFEDFNLTKFTSSDLIYCDPPYLITTGSYNDGNRGFKNWNINQEKKLLGLLDSLNEKRIRFALSNVLTHKGNKNDILIEWSNKYNVHRLNYNYSNSSHNTTKGDSEEVLITNY
ncbi:Dam family site-specific DNA-(adenine-N6)-methyltransferase [Clostridium botulinum]|uniref:Site-specific DNA-methyltransferase (adenine-specific) n=1 Tax=Clostridium botulinum TaxID=1491 RepID=A0AA43Y7Y4_CLOBO|nr:Dam family site-specific DNA-(adenine-N6)-methyltransferase [Clostridium botulinum]KEI99891.1 DNA adenine methylase [Clostridium botulinum A2B3 87]NFI06370.1 Dam family site-specific DNA-(adenine-N6)-methyltransferase [Clostridium botulinum]NFI21948.1 Dam family site-specific DNA-(adenine-N6)-methyltransferase [Clostridium botulinum]NFQ77817.1 Dam family site-specific DNA-(adenine-N6)-methyltransferase [Clostridium botulinum]